MATRELQTILSSGEITSIQIGGVTTDEKVLTSSEIEAITDPIDARVSTIEASHTLLMTGISVASSQEPTSTDTALQIEFGPLQSTTHVDLSATGVITFNATGRYIFSPFFQYGRVGASGTSILFQRMLINGVQVGTSLGAKIDNANTLVPWSSSVVVDATAGDELTIEIIRDSAGNNSGGLFQATPTIGWTTSPCASFQIYKAI